MNEESYFFFLASVIEGHNRWLISGKDVSAITTSSPCCGLHVHNPHEVQHWVVTLEQPQPLTTLTNFLVLVPAHLHTQLVQYTIDGLYDIRVMHAPHSGHRSP